jgi:hypothetical protein
LVKVDRRSLSNIAIALGIFTLLPEENNEAQSEAVKKQIDLSTRRKGEKLGINQPDLKVSNGVKTEQVFG